MYFEITGIILAGGKSSRMGNAGGPIIGWDGYAWNGTPCGCHHLSRVKLSGYPVREIVEVKIDGVVVAVTEYRLDEWRYLTRMHGGPLADLPAP